MEAFPPPPLLCLVACSVLVVFAVALGVVLSFGPPVTAFAVACSASRECAVPLLAASILAAPVVVFPASWDCVESLSAAPLLAISVVAAAVLEIAYLVMGEKVWFFFLSLVFTPRQEPSLTMLL